MNHLQQANFDIYAKSYDKHFTHSLVGQAQRNRVHVYLKRKTNITGNILELSCGTGEDALFLLQTCKSIVCTDISEGMIEECEKKVKPFANARVLVSSMEDIHKNVNGTFDLIFSNFGGLNCLSENELKIFLKDLKTLTDKNTELVLVIMGKKCLWERIYFLLKGNKTKAFRRMNKAGVFADLGSASQQTFYYSPREIKLFSEQEFENLSCRPIGFFVPPSYLNSFFERHSFLFFILRSLERLVNSFGFLSNYADHYLIHLKRK